MSDQGGSWSNWGWGLVSSVQSTTSQFVNDLAQAIEPEDDAQVPETRKESLVVGGDVGEDQPRAPAPVSQPVKGKERENYHGEERKPGDGEGGHESPSKDSQDKTSIQEEIQNDPVLRYIDSGVSFVGSSFEKIGSFLQKGVETVQTTDLDELTKKGSEMAKKLQEASQTAISSLKEELKDVVGEQYGVPEEEEGSDDSHSTDDAKKPTSEQPKKSEGSEEITYSAAFELSKGATALKGLEDLAMNSMMSSQSIYAALDFAQRQIIAERMAKVSELFKKEELSEEESKASFPLGDDFTAKMDLFKLSIENGKKKAAQMEQIAQTLSKFEAEGFSGLALAQRVFTESSHFTVLIKSECAKSLASLAVLALDFMCTFLDWLVKNEKVDKLLLTTVYLRLLSERFEAEIGEVSALFVESLKTLYNVSRAIIAKTGTEEETAQLRKELQSKVGAARNVMLIDSGSSVAHLQSAKKCALSVAKYLIFIAFQKREQILKQQQQQQQQSPAKPDAPS